MGNNPVKLLLLRKINYIYHNNMPSMKIYLLAVSMLLIYNVVFYATNHFLHFEIPLAVQIGSSIITTAALVTFFKRRNSSL